MSYHFFQNSRVSEKLKSLSLTTNVKMNSDCDEKDDSYCSGRLSVLVSNASQVKSEMRSVGNLRSPPLTPRRSQLKSCDTLFPQQGFDYYSVEAGFDPG